MPKAALALLMPSLSKGKGGASREEESEDTDAPDAATLKGEATAAILEAVEAKDADALQSALTSFYDACAMEE